MEIEYKSCPFCGGTDRFPPKLIFLSVPWSSVSVWTVECENCQASCGYSDKKEEAIDYWNTRLTNKNSNIINRDDNDN